MSINKRKMPFIGGIQESMQSQETHKMNFFRGRHLFMPFTNWVSILTLTNVSDTAWTDENVSAEVSEDAFAVLLYVAFNDSASASTHTYAKFRKNGSSSDGVGSVNGYHINNVFQTGHLIIPIDDNKIFEYNIEASGANTATLHLHLVGYYSKIT